jgi:hypothetical protein
MAEPHKTHKLAVDVTTDCYWATNRLDVGFFDENLASLDDD